MRWQLWLGLAGAVVVSTMFGFVLGAATMKVWLRVTSSSLTSTVPATEPEGKKWTREEFRKAIEGKTPDEVIRLIGRPTSTYGDPSAPFWLYVNIIYDDVALKQASVTVVFANGKANRFIY